MTKVLVPPKFPAPLSEKRWAKNSNIASTTAFRRAAFGLNHAASFCRKQVFAKIYDTQSTPAGVLAGTRNNYWIFRTGENVEAVEVIVGLVPVDTSYATAAPKVVFELRDGGSTYTSRTVYHSIVETAGVGSYDYTPDQINWVSIKLTADDGIAADTVYQGTLLLTNYCRVHSVVCYEVAPKVILSSGTGVVDALRYEAQSPVYDADVQDLLVQGTELWRHNARHLISWSQESAASGTSVSSASWTNLVSLSTAGYSATSAGWRFDTTYDLTYMENEVPVQLGVYATRASGTGNLGVRVVGSGGTEFTRTITASTGNPGDVSNQNLTATNDKFDIEINSADGSSVWNIWAVGLWEYEA